MQIRRGHGCAPSVPRWWICSRTLTRQASRTVNPRARPAIPPMPPSRWQLRASMMPSLQACVIGWLRSIVLCSGWTTAHTGVRFAADCRSQLSALMLIPRRSSRSRKPAPPRELPVGRALRGIPGHEDDELRRTRGPLTALPATAHCPAGEHCTRGRGFISVGRLSVRVPLRWRKRRHCRDPRDFPASRKPSPRGAVNCGQGLCTCLFIKLDERKDNAAVRDVRA